MGIPRGPLQDDERIIGTELSREICDRQTGNRANKEEKKACHHNAGSTKGEWQDVG